MSRAPGYKHTPETLAKMRRTALRRYNDPASGSREHIERIVKMAHEKPALERLSKSLMGHSFDITTRAKMSASRKSWWNSLSDEEKANALSNLRCRDKQSSIERMVCEQLDYAGISYVIEHKIAWYHVDIYIASTRTVIECDGEYWHSLPKHRSRDAAKDSYLRNHGYTLIRLPEKYIRRTRGAVLWELATPASLQAA